MIAYSPELQADLRDSTLILDTNVFSAAASSKPLLDLLASLRNQYGATYCTIPSVLHEVVVGSTSIEVYNERLQFVKGLVDRTLPAHTYIEKHPDFAVVMAKLNATNKSYVDYQLALSAYNYRASAQMYVMTTDQKALPSFFERVHLLTVEVGPKKVVNNFGISRFVEDKYIKAVQGLIA